MCRDGVRVEADEHHDAAEHGVAHDHPELRPAEPGEAAAPGLGGAGGDDRPSDRRAQDVGEHPVAELDGAVEAHLAGRRQAVVGALGPGGAAEAGTGQPHGTAGDDDDDGHDDGRHRRTADGPGGRRPALGDEEERVPHGLSDFGSGQLGHAHHRRGPLVQAFTRGTITPNRLRNAPAGSLPAEVRITRGLTPSGRTSPPRPAPAPSTRPGSPGRPTASRRRAAARP